MCFELASHVLFCIAAERDRVQPEDELMVQYQSADHRRAAVEFPGLSTPGQPPVDGAMSHQSAARVPNSRQQRRSCVGRVARRLGDARVAQVGVPRSVLCGTHAAGHRGHAVGHAICSPHAQPGRLHDTRYSLRLFLRHDPRAPAGGHVPGRRGQMDTHRRPELYVYPFHAEHLGVVVQNQSPAVRAGTAFPLRRPARGACPRSTVSCHPGACPPPPV